MAIGSTTTVIQRCGCITQSIYNTRTNHVYCGNKDCPFDEPGQHRKEKDVIDKNDITRVNKATLVPGERVFHGSTDKWGTYQGPREGDPLYAMVAFDDGVKAVAYPMLWKNG